MAEGIAEGTAPFPAAIVFISVQLVIIFPIWNQQRCRLFTQIPILMLNVDCDSDLDRDSSGPARLGWCRVRNPLYMYVTHTILSEKSGQLESSH